MANPMIHGVTNCARLTPKLPIPAWMPSAVPCSFLGKKNRVLGMNEEKSPPPKPASSASTINIQNGVAGFITARPMPMHGISFKKVATVMTWRVP